MTPSTPRSTITDVFALGCLIFEITTGIRPYNEIPDDEYEEIERRYAIGNFPCLKGNAYEDIIYKCWTAQYRDVEQLKDDLEMRRNGTH